MRVYRVIRTYAGGHDGNLVGFAKQYANGQWTFEPSPETGKKPTKRRFRNFDDCIPSWAGSVSGTRSEPVI